MLLLSKNDYCQFFLNGHLCKTDISLGLTPGVGPCRFSVILLQLYSL